MKKIFIVLFMPLLFAGCKNNDTNQTESKGLEFRATVLATKLDGNAQNFVSGDDFGLYGVEFEGIDEASQTPGEMVESGNMVDNHPYEFDGTDWSSDMDFPNALTWRKVAFYAYSPYNAASTDGLAVSYTTKVDQTVPADTANYFLYGVGEDNGEGYEPLGVGGEIVNIAFAHKTAIVYANITLPDTYNNKPVTNMGNAYVVNVPSGATLNMGSGELTPSATLVDVKMFGEVEGLVGQYKAVITPTFYLEGAPMIKVECEIGGNPDALFFYAQDADTVFISEGTKNTFNLEGAPHFGFLADLTEFLGTSAPTQTAKVHVTDYTTVGWTLESNLNWIEISLDGTTWTDSLTMNVADATGEITDVLVRVDDNTDGRQRLGVLTLTATDDTIEDVELVVHQGE